MPQILITKILTGIQHLHIAILLLHAAAQPEGQSLRDGTGHDGIDTTAVTLLKRGNNFPFERVARSARNIVHRAARRIAPVERALRSPQNFHALEVHLAQQRHCGAREENAIDIGCNGGFSHARIDRRANTAHCHECVSPEFSECQIRYLQGEVFDIIDTARL